MALLCVAATAAAGLTAGEGFSPSAGTLLASGGNAAPALAAGEAWRLVSAIVLHGSLAHLAANLVAWIDIGRRLQRDAGTALTLALLVAAGAGGFLLSALWHPDTVSVGLSGALVGGLGWLAVRALRRRQPVREYLVWLALVAATGWFVATVDNAAHLGGFLVGGALAALLPVTPASVHRCGVAAALALTGLFLVATTALPAAWAVPYRETSRFEADYRRFAATDSEVAAQLRALAARTDSPAGLTAAQALTALARIETAVAAAHAEWQATHYATAWIEAERELVARYIARRQAVLAALQQAIATDDAAALARFERARADADALAEALGDAARRERARRARQAPSPDEAEPRAAGR